MPIEIAGLTLYSTDEIVGMFKGKVKAATIRTYIRTGKMKGQKVGNSWYVSGGNLREFF